MKKYIAIFSLLISGFMFSQQGSKEIGVDLNFWASNNGGSINVAPRFGYEAADNFVIGPSVRYINHWSTLYGQKFSSNIFGFGLYGHYRFIEWLYAGADFELYFTPYNYKVGATKPKSVAPALILSAGLSRKIGERFRINAGINYDIINNVNSPLRPSYIAQTAKGVRIPLFYRVAFIFSI
ncbi:MAG: hypothetical protein J0G96_04280 [Flavobacteriia bacterium]|nr:hypothetical protein [Flavobacteriia bacterium]OJX36988.1 MAG: hypothetical protein BGO87_14510 [Flavobacteriia bacterium 40-80]